MRALACLFVAMLLVVACENDDATEASLECQRTRSASLVSQFTPTEPADYVVWRTERSRGGGASAEITVHEEHGSPSATAATAIDALRFCDEEKCPPPEEAYELRSDGSWRLICFGSARVGGVSAPGYTITELVVARGDDVRLLTTRDELLAFFGTIDTKAEAAFLAHRDGFVASGCKFDSITETADGFEMEMPTASCALAPGGKDAEWIRLHVGRDGRTRIVSRRPLPPSAR